MTPITITVPGKPMAWQRSRQNGKLHFESREQTAHKELIRWSARKVYKGMPLDCPLRLDVICYFLPSEELAKKQPFGVMEEMIPHAKKPDGDNLLKMVSDALTGFIWTDDARISLKSITKLYSSQPRTEITVREFLTGGYGRA